jgi:hypothetical protein
LGWHRENAAVIMTACDGEKSAEQRRRSRPQMYSPVPLS